MRAQEPPPRSGGRDPRPGQRAAQGRAMCAERPLGSVRRLPDPLSASPGVTAQRDRPRCAPRAPGTNRVGSRGLSATAQEKRKKPAVPHLAASEWRGGRARYSRVVPVHRQMELCPQQPAAAAPAAQTRPAGPPGCRMGRGHKGAPAPPAGNAPELVSGENLRLTAVMPSLPLCNILPFFLKLFPGLFGIQHGLENEKAWFISLAK